MSVCCVAQQSGHGMMDHCAGKRTSAAVLPLVAPLLRAAYWRGTARPTNPGECEEYGKMRPRHQACGLSQMGGAPSPPARLDGDRLALRPTAVHSPCAEQPSDGSTIIWLLCLWLQAGQQGRQRHPVPAVWQTVVGGHKSSATPWQPLNILPPSPARCKLQQGLHMAPKCSCRCTEWRPLQHRQGLYTAAAAAAQRQHGNRQLPGTPLAN